MKTTQVRSSTKLRMSTLMMLAVGASPMVQAQDAGWYGGVSAGQTETDFRGAELVSALQGRGFGTTALNLDEDDTGWKVLGGYSINKWLAFEASYTDLGEFSALATLNPPGQLLGEASMRGAGIDLVGSLPLTTRFSALARIGMNNTRIKQDFSGPDAGAPFSGTSDRDFREKYGVGLEFRFTDDLSLRTEYERFKIDDNRATGNDVDMLSLGLVYRFGRRAAAPAPVVEAPAPAPAPARAPAPEPMRVTLDAETLFDFDRAELRPAGRTELDNLVRELRGVDYEVVIVTGHTDRIGTREYNLGLSERRANAVRDYLVAAGVPSGSITARGVNSDEPVTTPQQCQGRRGQDLIACYQPDRRVEVEVNGTREAE